MGKCGICGKGGGSSSLITANHRKLGYIQICSDCWEKLYGENKFVACTTSSGSSCPTCE